MARGPEKKDFVAVVRETWGEDAPRWVVVLAERCTEERQAAVARRLEVSASMISAVLSNTYTAKGGSTAGLEAKVRGAYMGETVDCPVLGEIGTDRCRTEQREPFRATSAMRPRSKRSGAACGGNIPPWRCCCRAARPGYGRADAGAGADSANQ